MIAPPPQPSEPKRWYRRPAWRYVFGLVNALLSAAIVGQLIVWFADLTPGQYGLWATVFLPILMGVIAAYSWGELRLTTRQLAFGSLLLTLLGLVGAALFWLEGVICLIMASPLLWGMIHVGCLAGDNWFRKNHPLIRGSLIPVLIAILVADCRVQSVHRDSVTTTMLVHAPAARVARHIVAFPPISRPSGFWLCRFGLPYPVVTTAEAERVGAERKCILSQDIVIDERITGYTPGRSVDFDVTEQPRWPEIANHVDLERGRIEVRDNGDGTSTLIGTSWYALRVYPIVYFNPWTALVIHNVHNRVFDHIRELSEREP